MSCSLPCTVLWRVRHNRLLTIMLRLNWRERPLYSKRPCKGTGAAWLVAGKSLENCVFLLPRNNRLRLPSGGANQFAAGRELHLLKASAVPRRTITTVNLTDSEAGSMSLLLWRRKAHRQYPRQTGGGRHSPCLFSHEDRRRLLQISEQNRTRRRNRSPKV